MNTDILFKMSFIKNISKLVLMLTLTLAGSGVSEVLAAKKKTKVPTKEELDLLNYNRFKDSSISMYAKNLFKETILYMDSALMIYPDSSISLEMRAESYIALKYHDKALQILDTLFSMNSKDSVVAIKAFEILEKDKTSYAQMLAKYESYLEKTGSNTDDFYDKNRKSLDYLVDFVVRAGVEDNEILKVREFLSKVAVDSVLDISKDIFLGDIAFELTEFPTAINYYQNFLSKNNFDNQQQLLEELSIKYRIIVALFMSKEYKKAVTFYEKEASILSKKVAAMNLYALSLFFVGDMDKGCLTLKKITEVPNSESANNYAIAPYIKNDFIAALSHLNVAIKLAKTPDGTLFYNRGCIYKAMLDDKNADVDFKKAKELGFKF